MSGKAGVPAMLLAGWLASGAGLWADGPGPAEAVPHANYLVRNWSTVDGLPDTTVRAILQGRDGYLWVGTAGGLSRFDGIRFRNFTVANSPGLASDNLVHLMEDREGRIWVSSTHGVSVLEGETLRQVTPEEGVPVGSTGTVLQDGTGAIWLESEQGIYRRVGDRFEKVPAEGAIPDIKVDATGRVWAGGVRGLQRWDGERFVVIPNTPSSDTIAVEPGGAVWMLRFPNQLRRWNEGRVEEMPSPGNEWFQALAVLPGGDVWLGARVGSRVVRYRGRVRHQLDADDGLHGARPVCFHQDQAGNLWIGSNRGGLFRLREPRLQLFRTGIDLPSGGAVGVTMDGSGRVHLAMMGAGLLGFDGERFHPLQTGDPRSPLFLITSIIPMGDQGLWVGTQFGGLRRWNGRLENEPKLEGGGTRVLLQDKSGRVWRGTPASGLQCLEDGRVRHYGTTSGLGSDAITALAEAVDGSLWVGTEKGLNHISGGRVNRFGVRDGLGHEWIRALCVDRQGTLWVGTAGGGLSVWKEGRFVTLGAEQGLPHGRVDVILDDHLGHLWVGTPSGLVRLSIDDLRLFVQGRTRRVHGTIFGAEDGLPVPQFGTGHHPAATMDRKGNLWFCSDSGVVRLDPGNLPPPAPAPVVHVEEVWIDGHRAGAGGRTGFATVPASGERVEIIYTGLEFSAPERIRFRYRLEGYDEDWVDARDQRVARYSKLKPGEYRFRIEAANNDGAWSASPRAFLLRVEPAFWQTLWFQGGTGLCLVAGCVLLVWARISAIERRRAAEESFTQQLIQSQEQERSRIADELHDSLGHGLLVIKNRASLALGNASDPDRLTRELREVSALAMEAIREVRSIARNLRPFQLDELGLTKSITAIVRNLADASSIEFHVSLDQVDAALEPEARINFYRIVQECLNNVVKHSQARSATVGLRWSEHSLRLTVTDDGCGFRPPAPGLLATAGFGLGTIAQRARTLGGDVLFDSEPGRGTRVIVEVRAATARPTGLASSHTQTFRKNPG